MPAETATALASREISPVQAATLHGIYAGAGLALLWTIYASPSDHPGAYVARPFILRGPRALRVHLAAADLATLRAALPANLLRLSRALLDDAAIVEAWL